jgi:4-hydroxybenzoate polyprenyltransferase
MRKILNEFVYGGHLLSLGASTIVLTVILLLELEINIIILIIPYLISQVIYSYNHFRELKYDIESNPERSKFIKRRKRLTALQPLMYSIILVLITLLFSNSKTSLFTFFFVLGGIAYTDIFKDIAAKHIVSFKNLYTSFFWGAIIFLILPFYNINASSFFIYFFFFTFYRWIINTVFFDIKDITSDKKRGLKTIPVFFGKKKTIFFLFIVNILTLVPLIFGIYDGEIDKSALILVFLSFYSFYYLSKGLFIDGKSLRILSYIVVDGEYLFWPILVFIGRTLF